MGAPVLAVGRGEVELRLYPVEIIGILIDIAQEDGLGALGGVALYQVYVEVIHVHVILVNGEGGGGGHRQHIGLRGAGHQRKGLVLERESDIEVGDFHPGVSYTEAEFLAVIIPGAIVNAPIIKLCMQSGSGLKAAVRICP